jgi:hypothetical protein
MEKVIAGEVLDVDFAALMSRRFQEMPAVQAASAVQP